MFWDKPVPPAIQGFQPFLRLMDYQLLRFAARSGDPLPDQMQKCFLALARMPRLAVRLRIIGLINSHETGSDGGLDIDQPVQINVARTCSSSFDCPVSHAASFQPPTAPQAAPSITHAPALVAPSILVDQGAAFGTFDCRTRGSTLPRTPLARSRSRSDFACSPL